MKSFCIAIAMFASLVVVGCKHENESTPAATSAAKEMSMKDCCGTCDTKDMELGHAKYHAEQVHNVVYIHADGENPSAGYTNCLVQSMLRIWPPQYGFYQKKPDGMAAQVITPFSVSAKFNAEDRIAEVVVNDADGRHVVNVDQAND